MTHPTDSAFPVQRQLDASGDVLTYAEVGLTKREYFAIEFAKGMCASESESDGFWKDEKLIARALERADRLLAELAK